jgi:hypothetical protein
VTAALVVITDGRDDCLGETIGSLNARLDPATITERWIYSDVGSDSHVTRLVGWFPHYRIVSAGRRLGFGGAIQFMWEVLLNDSTAEHIAWWEDDMVLTRPLNLQPLVDVLTERPHLAQMALRRQPVNDAEKAAGGVVEQHPDAYLDHRDHAGREWLEHSLFYTTNPSVFRRELCATGWPEGKHSEGRYGFQLREQGLPWGIPGGDVRFGFWGPRTDPPLIRHIGEHRAGTGY